MTDRTSFLWLLLFWSEKNSLLSWSHDIEVPAVFTWANCVSVSCILVSATTTGCWLVWQLLSIWIVLGFIDGFNEVPCKLLCLNSLTIANWCCCCTDWFWRTHGIEVLLVRHSLDAKGLPKRCLGYWSTAALRLVGYRVVRVKQPRK